MTPRQQQIIGAMQGRMAAQVNDSALRDAVRSKLVEIGTKAGKPLQTSQIGGLVVSVLQTAAKTILFEAEIPIALEMGAAGELAHEGTSLNQTNVSGWVKSYACCGDRHAARQQISLQSARDRARTDAVAADTLREEFQRDGLRRAWQTFQEEGWGFRPGYAAALYRLTGTANIREILKPEQIAQAKADARAALRHDDPRRYRTMPEEELDASPVLQMYWKAQLCRAYFETLKALGLDINYRLTKSQTA